jgi:hypothetical protein
LVVMLGVVVAQVVFGILGSRDRLLGLRPDAVAAARETPAREG